VNLVQLVRDLGGRAYEGPSWSTWTVVLKGLCALPLTASEQAVFRRHTGGAEPPAQRVREAWILSGRRSGKTLMAAGVAVGLAAEFLVNRRERLLAPGETAVVLVLASDKLQGRIAFGYICGLIDASPILAAEIDSRTRERIRLGRVEIRVATSSFRGVRGYTLIGVIADEVAFWRDEETSLNPAEEVLAALRPGLSTLPGSLLLCITSVYARRGPAWEAYQRHYGKPSAEAVVWLSDSRTLNPSLPQSVIDAALAEDESRAAAEYLSIWRSDVEQFVSVETVRSCTVLGRVELPPARGISYRAFTDPSGGSADSWTLAIGHRERDGRIVVDLLRERKAPFAPSEAAADLAALCKAYHCTEVVGDRFAGDFPREAFRAHGIPYRPAEKNKSELYVDLLPLLNSRAVELVEHPRLHAQLIALERITSRGGRDSIDHPRRAHDDLANAVAGLASLLSRKKLGVSGSTTWGGSWESDASGLRYFSKDGVELLCIEPDDPQAAQKAFVAERLAQARARR